MSTDTKAPSAGAKVDCLLRCPKCNTRIMGHICCENAERIYAADDCACCVLGDGSIEQPFSIIYCSQHSRASETHVAELVEALEACYENAKLFNRDTDACWVVVRDMCESALQRFKEGL